MTSYWVIKNTKSGACLRTQFGDVIMFVTHKDAQDYIDNNLPKHLWDASVVHKRRYEQ